MDTGSRNLGDFAARVGTTLEQLYQDNRGLKATERHLRPETILNYHLASSTPDWSTWKWALHKYNSETHDPDYVKKVLRYYDAVNKRWPEDSIRRQPLVAIVIRRLASCCEDAAIQMRSSIKELSSLPVNEWHANCSPPMHSNYRRTTRCFGNDRSGRGCECSWPLRWRYRVAMALRRTVPFRSR